MLGRRRVPTSARSCVTFVEPTATGGGLERRVLFEDGIEADFALFPAGAVERYLLGRGLLEALLVD